MAEISVDTHGRAYLSYPSNANPATLNTQCFASSKLFHFSLGTFYIIISPLRNFFLLDGQITWDKRKSPEINNPHERISCRPHRGNGLENNSQLSYE